VTGHDASKVRVIPSLPWIDVGMLDLAGFDLESPWVSVHDLPLAVLELSTRPRTVLARASIRTIGELVALSHDDVLAKANMGAASYAEIVVALDRFGVRLRDDEWSAQVRLRRDVQRVMWARVCSGGPQ